MMDVLVINTQERIYGWPIFDYVEFATYRFTARTRRWKANEQQMDEMVNEELQPLDRVRTRAHQSTPCAPIGEREDGDPIRSLQFDC